MAIASITFRVSDARWRGIHGTRRVPIRSLQMDSGAKVAVG